MPNDTGTVPSDTGAHAPLPVGVAEEQSTLTSVETFYAEGDGYQALELPYDGNQLSMLVRLRDSR
jgi:hypothetical protein